MTMTDTPTPADKIRQALAQRADDIRKRPELMPQAKRAMIAKAYTAAKAKMDEVASTAQSDAATTKKALTHRAFGAGDLTANASPAESASVAISARDAGDRADQLTTPDEALALLTRAETQGDEILCRAIAAKAHSIITGSGSTPGIAHQWEPVMQAYSTDRPKQTTALNSLRALGPDPHPFDAAVQWIVPPPSELAGLDDYSIAKVADDPMAQAG